MLNRPLRKGNLHRRGGVSPLTIVAPSVAEGPPEYIRTYLFREIPRLALLARDDKGFRDWVNNVGADAYIRPENFYNGTMCSIVPYEKANPIVGEGYHPSRYVSNN